MSKKPTIAAGAVAAGGAGAMGAAAYTSKDIEAAMSEAITKAHADGITDPTEVRALMQAARKRVVQGA
jgi:uncharacterized protein YdgA (DUF945 family)